MRTGMLSTFAVVLLTGCLRQSPQALYITSCSRDSFVVAGQRYSGVDRLDLFRKHLKEHGSQSPVYFVCQPVDSYTSLFNAVNAAAVAGLWNIQLQLGPDGKPEPFVGFPGDGPARQEIAVTITERGLVGEIGSLSDLRQRLSVKPTNDLPYMVWIRLDYEHNTVSNLYDVLTVCNAYKWVEACPVLEAKH
jgi:hypothetical protein